VEKTLDDTKADDVVAVSLAGKSSIADYMVIASGRSQRQVWAMAEHLRDTLKASGLRQVHVEGRAQSDWVLVDAGDIVVHLFKPELRAFYALEKMWAMDLDEADRATGTA
jgi:ribosome-associated protein